MQTDTHDVSIRFAYWLILRNHWIQDNWQISSNFVMTMNRMSWVIHFIDTSKRYWKRRREKIDNWHITTQSGMENLFVSNKMSQNWTSQRILQSHRQIFYVSKKGKNACVMIPNSHFDVRRDWDPPLEKFTILKHISLDKKLCNCWNLLNPSGTQTKWFPFLLIRWVYVFQTSSFDMSMQITIPDRNQFVITVPFLKYFSKGQFHFPLIFRHLYVHVMTRTSRGFSYAQMTLFVLQETLKLRIDQKEKKRFWYEKKFLEIRSQRASISKKKKTYEN